MESLDVFLIALVIILIIIIVYQNRKFFDKPEVKSTTTPVTEHWNPFGPSVPTGSPFDAQTGSFNGGILI